MPLSELLINAPMTPTRPGWSTPAHSALRNAANGAFSRSWDFQTARTMVRAGKDRAGHREPTTSNRFLWIPFELQLFFSFFLLNRVRCSSQYFPCHLASIDRRFDSNLSTAACVLPSIYGRCPWHVICFGFATHHEPAFFRLDITVSSASAHMFLPSIIRQLSGATVTSPASVSIWRRSLPTKSAVFLCFLPKDLLHAGEDGTLESFRSRFFPQSGLRWMRPLFFLQPAWLFPTPSPSLW